jgi:hypothetical protein
VRKGDELGWFEHGSTIILRATFAEERLSRIAISP